ncbi:MAG: pyridoxal phosphate-dependent class II aminotransferase, partial [Candidatus Latescibacteria bacterium]|nr:pyridoxal phosphate-dependent class II aminotransferase [Candidatus Latescibacterota bacterium]
SIVHYPDPQCSDLVEKLSTHHQIDPETLLIGNGVSGLIYLLARIITSDAVLIPVPTFCEYERAVRISGGQVIRFYMREDEGFRLDLGQLTQELSGVSAVFLGRPNNPTGSVIPKDPLLAFAGECERRGIFLIVDEAFVDFSETAELVSLINEIKQFQHLIVLRSFTKIYAFPGLRLGYAVAHPPVIKQLRRLQPPWSVNTLAQRAGVLVLDCPGYLQRTRELIRRERTFLFNRLAQMDGIVPFPSDANFILCEIHNISIDAAILRRLLGQQGILIREGSSFEGLSRYFFRIAVRSRRENEILLGALRNALPPNRGKEGGGVNFALYSPMP